MFDTPLKGNLMKRLIAAVSLSALAVPALAEIGLPYDQNLVDRQLPQIEQQAEARSDRRQFAAAAGDTRSDVEIATREALATQAPNGSALATGPWADDYHFIAPAQ